MKRQMIVILCVSVFVIGLLWTCSWNNPYAAGFIAQPTAVPGTQPTPGIDLTPPAEVTDLAAAGQDSQVTLSWTEPADADYSYVEISGAGFTTVTVPKGTSATVITGLINGTLYNFLVKSADLTGNQSSGETANTTTTDRWTESPLNPLFGGAASGTDRAYYPCVVKAGSTYHVWYGDGTTTRHATSTFADLHDIAHPAPVITVATVVLTTAIPGAYHPSVCYNAAGWIINSVTTSDPFVMYIAESLNGAMRVIHSSDGAEWTQFTVGGACTGLAAGAYNLSVLYEGGTDWKAYSDDGAPQHYYYTSTDGYAWTVQATGFLGATYQTAWESDTGRRLVPRIVKDGSRYCLFYSSGLARNDSAIGKAVSSDGVNFTLDVNNPVLSMNDGIAWRDSRTYTAWVIWDNDHWRMYYSGLSSIGSVYSIGTAVKYGRL